MERIKEALEKAREQREQGSNGEPGSLQAAAASGSRLGNDRVLEREPFRQFSATQQRRLLETGRILNIGAGETLQFVGDKDFYVHYLLSGAVVAGSGDDAKTVSADEDVALQPLDVAGVKANTITAASDTEVFRVPYAVLPVTVEVQGEAPLPTSAYTETYSGQQLANLVEQITAEHDTLDRPSVDPQVLADLPSYAPADNFIFSVDYEYNLCIFFILRSDRGSYRRRAGEFNQSSNLSAV